MTKLKLQCNKKMYFTNIKIAKIFITYFMMLVLTAGSAGGQSLRETPIVKAVNRVSPAVVNISTEYEVSARSPFSSLGDPFFDSFFRDFFDHGYRRPQRRHSLGSGVIIDGQRGFILTNAHVIERSGVIKVTLQDEREFEAQIIGADSDSDLAVLRISSDSSLPSVEMGTSEDIMIGETVIAIGNPFGFSHTVTTGVISAINRSIRTDKRVYEDFLQIDASINPGNSGGPLLNIEGSLIGVNTAIYAGSQGIGFAIPIDKAKKVVTNLIQYGEIVQAWIGISIQELDTGMAEYLKTEGGVLINNVEANSPAFKAGIREGDIILKVNKKHIRSADDYDNTVRGFTAGEQVDFHILRQSAPMTVIIKTDVFPEKMAPELITVLLGISVDNPENYPAYRRFASRREGVVITRIDRRSHLAQIGARTGDIIRQIDDIPIKNVTDFHKAIIKSRLKTSVVMLLQRGDRGYYISVKLR